jgi:hypothetical protein
MSSQVHKRIALLSLVLIVITSRLLFGLTYAPYDEAEEDLTAETSTNTTLPSTSSDTNPTYISTPSNSTLNSSTMMRLMDQCLAVVLHGLFCTQCDTAYGDLFNVGIIAIRRFGARLFFAAVRFLGSRRYVSENTH